MERSGLTSRFLGLAQIVKTMYLLPFDTQVNFLDPRTTSDGEPYAPYRYKEIVRECYLISRFCNTSYLDIQQITPRERDYLLEFIKQERDLSDKLVQELKDSKN